LNLFIFVIFQWTPINQNQKHIQINIENEIFVKHLIKADKVIIFINAMLIKLVEFDKLILLSIKFINT